MSRPVQRSSRLARCRWALRNYSRNYECEPIFGLNFKQEKESFTGRICIPKDTLTPGVAFVVPHLLAFTIWQPGDCLSLPRTAVFLHFDYFFLVPYASAAVICALLETQASLDFFHWLATALFQHAFY
jgi:hypothetical protein